MILKGLFTEMYTHFRDGIYNILTNMSTIFIVSFIICDTISSSLPKCPYLDAIKHMHEVYIYVYACGCKHISISVFGHKCSLYFCVCVVVLKG